jgi:hypothetical protein
MSRRSHHPARRHVRPHAEARPPRPAAATDAASAEPVFAPAGDGAVERPAQTPQALAAPMDALVPEELPADATPVDEPQPELPAVGAPAMEPGSAEPIPGERAMVVAPALGFPVRAPVAQARPAPGRAAGAGSRPSGPPQAGPGDAERNACTAPQLRRFIKSRAYVPMHELRRRFGIEGDDDDVTGVQMGVGTMVYVGLPQREGLLLGELLKARDVGYELSLDPISPIVVGVFPMRPIPRS